MVNCKEQMRERILASALEMFAENGFHSAPMAALAGRAGIGVGSIYRYFKGKEELIHSVYQLVDQDLSLAIRVGLSSVANKRQRFILLICNLATYLRTNPLAFRFLEQYYSSPFGLESKREKILQVDEGTGDSPFINLFVSDHEVHFRPLPRPVVRSLIFGPAICLLRDHLAGLIDFDDRMILSMAEACWHAITQPVAPSASENAISLLETPL